MALDRAAIMRDGSPARALPIISVPVPEWSVDPAKPESVFIRMLMGEERDRYEAAGVKLDKNGQPQPAMENARARLAVACVCDEKGTLLFGPDDVGEVGRLNAAGLDRIYEAATKHSKMDRASREEARGNSAPGPSAGQSSPSRASTDGRPLSSSPA